MISQLYTLRKRAPWEQRLLLEAAIYLGTARLLVLILPFRWITPWLGVRQAESAATSLSADEEHIAQQVGQAVRTCSRHTWWRSNCLAQAIAGSLMLQRRKIPYTLYLGVKMNGPKLEAHAWLRSGPHFLTGNEVRQQFTTLATFARPAGETSPAKE